MSCAIALYCVSMLWTTSTAPTDSIDARGPVAQPHALHRVESSIAEDTTTRRKAVALSDWYVRRLTVHRYASYAMLPLFVGEFFLGQKLLSQKDGVYDGTRRVPIDGDLRRNHRIVAVGLGTVFATNTVTGLWNLWEARHDGSSSGRRTAHVLGMLAADAGFAASGVMAQRAVQRRPSDARAHRNVALASMGVAIGSVSLMWF